VLAGEEGVEHRLAYPRVEAVERVVEDEHHGLAGDRTRNREPAFLARAQRLAIRGELGPEPLGHGIDVLEQPDLLERATDGV